MESPDEKVLPNPSSAFFDLGLADAGFYQLCWTIRAAACNPGVQSDQRLCRSQQGRIQF